MDTDNCKLFERVAKKMGWMEMGGLDVAEEKLIGTIRKTRHPGTSGAKRGSPDPLENEDADKENRQSYRNNALIDSSDDDDFDQFLTAKATPKTKVPSQKTLRSTKKDSIVVVSSDSDGTFETFLQRVKTPNVKSRTISKSGSEDSIKNFIVDNSSSDDDLIEAKSSSRVPKKSYTPSSQPLLRRPLSRDSSVFVSDGDDDDDNIVMESSWRTRPARPQPSSNFKKKSTTLHDNENSSPLVPADPAPLSVCPSKTLDLLASDVFSNSSKRTLSAPPRLDESQSSEEEFSSLLERLKRKNKLPSSTLSPAPSKESSKKPVLSQKPVNGPKSPGSKSLNETPLNFNTPRTTFKPVVSQTEPRHGASRVPLCKTPGCFLESLSNPRTIYGRNFKQNKEELTSKLYYLYNTTVFDGKLPANMSVTWNKKMRKTAGYCITGQERGGGNRYARIELSDKVCDSADRLRDTLIHEMCHAATWLINCVRDGHGNFWKLYARKSTLVHPELPMVTRCHSYDIKYKFQYQCIRCQNTIGRHSKSLDTERFVCALCTGKLVLLNPPKPRTATPFANFVKENYGVVRQELVGQSHAEVMRKLSADFSSKTKFSQS